MRPADSMTKLPISLSIVALGLSVLLRSCTATPYIAVSDDVASCMKAQPYVEESCKVSSFPGWPYDAKDCSYSTPIGTLYVTVADAPADRVASWVLNATLTVPWTADLQSAHPGAFLQVQKILAVDVMYQSGRIFALKGDVGEDMDGKQYIAYPFKDGVSVGCPASEPHCFCRINSISRGQFCTWRAHTSDETEDKCRSRLGYAQGNTDAWYNECLANHASAWHSEYNDHFAAKLFAALKDAGISKQSTPDDIENALYSEFGLSASDVAKFC